MMVMFTHCTPLCWGEKNETTDKKKYTLLVVVKGASVPGNSLRLLL